MTSDANSPSGTCQACFRAQKTRDGLLVLHGYKRPGYGYIEGRCFGVGFAPFEVSCERTKQFIAGVLKPALVMAHETLAFYKGRPETLQYTTTTGYGSEERVVVLTLKVGDEADYTRGTSHPSYESHLDHLIFSAERHIVQVESDLKFFETKIVTWKSIAWPIAREAMPVEHKTTVRRPSMYSFEVTATCKCGWRVVFPGQGARGLSRKAAQEHLKAVGMVV